MNIFANILGKPSKHESINLDDAKRLFEEDKLDEIDLVSIEKVLEDAKGIKFPDDAKQDCIQLLNMIIKHSSPPVYVRNKCIKMLKGYIMIAEDKYTRELAITITFEILESFYNKTA